MRRVVGVLLLVLAVSLVAFVAGYNAGLWAASRQAGQTTQVGRAARQNVNAGAATVPAETEENASDAGAPDADGDASPAEAPGERQGSEADSAGASESTDAAPDAGGSPEAKDSVAGDGDVTRSDAASAQELARELGLVQDMRDEFVHGQKGPEYQRYIVLHDTESNASPEGIVDAWDSQGTGVAAHFVVGRDGSVVQCVPLDAIAHHAGFGDAGHNREFGVEDESRDDKAGTSSIGSRYPDYGMNSYSVGIELVHVGSSDSYYPEAQLDALDRLIAYIDAYYGGPGKGGTIIDHKMWRTTNSDTSAEFSRYLQSYRSRRTHA